MPVLLAVLALHHWMGRHLGQYTPWQTDELSYWHQISTFTTAGFGNGYYTLQELTPSLPVDAYGPWGPAFPALYGALLFPFGMTLVSVVKLNMVVFAVVAGVSLFLARLDLRRTLLLAALLATFTPLLRELVTGMEEPLHFAFGVLLAVLFHRLIVGKIQARWVLLAVLVAALIRPTWGFLLIPAALLAFRSDRRRQVWGAAGATVAAFALGVLFTVWSAPFPFTYLAMLRATPSLSGKFALLGANIERNLSLLPRLTQPFVYTAPVIGYQVMGCALIGVVAVGLAVRRRADPAVPLTVALALLPPLALIVTMYDEVNGMRTLAPHVLFAGVLFGVTRKRWTALVPVLLIVSNLLTVGWYRHDLISFSQHDYSEHAGGISRLRTELGRSIRFRPGADRWCNTILLSTDGSFLPQFVGVPAGFGLSLDLDHRFDGPLKSAYVLTTPTSLVLLPGRGADLVPLEHTEVGELYRNPRSPCYA